MSSCRGSFLHYATQDDLQQVLNLNCGPLWRYAALLRACAGRPLTVSDQATLDRHGELPFVLLLFLIFHIIIINTNHLHLYSHCYVTTGMRAAALGPQCPLWLRKYTADNLSFMEYERKALPCALMRSTKVCGFLCFFHVISTPSFLFVVCSVVIHIICCIDSYRQHDVCLF